MLIRLFCFPTLEQYIKSLVPQHFYLRTNNNGITAAEIFKRTHEGLIVKSNEWLQKTSESCSVVAVLIAGASFTTASAVPGGTAEGRPILEDNPAFNVFAFASLSGLCFSVTALIMFLSILTSQKQAKDFHRNLPLQLYIALSSLFVALASMFVSFCTGHFFLISHRFKPILFPIYAAACLPVAFYGAAQIPLYYYLLKAIFARIPKAAIDNGNNF